MGELETDPKTESPLFPPIIISTEVVLNPFEDIIPRERIVLEAKNVLVQASASASNSKLGRKNVSLLSFDTEDDSSANVVRTAVTSASVAVVTLENVPSAPLSAPLSAPSTPLAPLANSSVSSLQFLQQMKSIQMKETQEKIKRIEQELGFKSNFNSNESRSYAGFDEKTSFRFRKAQSKVF